LSVLFQVSGEGLPLPADVQVQVLHVVQEALSNIRKHARATQVVLEVGIGAHWRIAVADDGIGFAPGQALPQSSHVGLKIMQERAARIGASVQVQSEAGQGTKVTLVLPAHPVSGVRSGTLKLNEAALAALENDAFDL
jgi:two-component system nitrate/nitrite sensor histidine kinase NarX